MNRTGFGRHGRIDDASGDPLDGLVNLFDIGIVLAVAFLIAGISVAPKGQARGARPAGTTQRSIPDITKASPRASGRGDSVGRVYRLPSGKLVLVEGK